MSGFIEVKKITTESKKDESGQVIREPGTQKPIPGGFKVVSEIIRIDEIKSIRTWNKSAKQNESIEGELTLLYMFGNKEKKEGEKFKHAEILIQESYTEFGKRLGANMVV